MGDKAIANEIEKLKQNVTKMCLPRAVTALTSRWPSRARHL